MSCSVCVAKYNKSTCAKVVCMCDYDACKTCVQTYLLNTIQEPHCMKCRNKWSFDFVKNNLGASFVNGALKEHQTKIITENSLAKREEIIPLAIQYRNDQANKKKINELREKISELRKQMDAYYDQIYEIENENRIQNGERRRAGAYRRMMNNIGGGAAPEPEPEPKLKKNLVMPCQNTDCRGMLNDKYYCELCDKKTCSKCLEVENENHECNPDSVESAKMLRKDSKPCPKCGTRISKIDGCDQMWCIECKTAFSWNKGTIETTHIHNPHYYEYLRKNNPSALVGTPRQLCRNVRDEALHNLIRYGSKNSRMVTRFIRYSNHINATCIRPLNTSIENKKNNVRTLEIKYFLGELTKEQLSDKLMANHRSVLKDQIFKDIYDAIVMMTDQLCNDINAINPINDVKNFDIQCSKTWNRIIRFTGYFNMELIRALMLYDSKRVVEMFDVELDRTTYIVKYESKKEMNADLEKFSAIYNNDETSNIGGGSEIVFIE